MTPQSGGNCTSTHGRFGRVSLMTPPCSPSTTAQTSMTTSTTPQSGRKRIPHLGRFSASIHSRLDGKKLEGSPVSGMNGSGTGSTSQPSRQTAGYLCLSGTPARSPSTGPHCGGASALQDWTYQRAGISQPLSSLSPENQASLLRAISGYPPITAPRNFARGLMPDTSH